MSAGQYQLDEKQLEQELGIRAAVLELWRPTDEAPDLMLADELLVQRSAGTRRRIASVHLVASGLLSGNVLAAAAELEQQGPVSQVLTAVRALLLAQDLDDHDPALRSALRPAVLLAGAWTRELLAQSAQPGAGHGAELGAELGLALHRGRTDGTGPERVPLLQRVCEALPPEPGARYGLAAACVAGLAASLLHRQGSSGDRTALAQEQAALAIGYVDGDIVRWSDGHLSIVSV